MEGQVIDTNGMHFIIQKKITPIHPKEGLKKPEPK
jgi:hypothetical protein